jgi:hypothetical protein
VCVGVAAAQRGFSLLEGYNGGVDFRTEHENFPANWSVGEAENGQANAYWEGAMIAKLAR